MSDFVIISIALSDIRTNGTANHRSADWTLLEASIEALAHGEVAARDEHHCARSRHAHDADALFRIGWRWLRGCWDIGLRLFWGWVIVRAMPQQLLGASHEVGIRVDVLLCFPFLVGPQSLEELLC